MNATSIIEVNGSYYTGFKIHTKREKLEALEAIGYEYMSIAKHYDTFHTGRGELVCLRLEPIKTTLYFDDEREDPAAGPYGLEGAFFAYNRHHALADCIKWAQAREDLRTRGCCSGKWAPTPSIYRYSDTDPYELEFFRREWRDNKAPDSRELNPDEVAALVSLANLYEVAHLERLRKYFKRYPHKIYTSGYWANA